MEFSIRRVNALFKKEIKDLGKNINVLLTCLIPILMCIIFSKIFNKGQVKIEILFMCIGMNFMLASSYVVALLISEEKEKNTLRTLMLSAVSPWEFLISKALVTLLLSIITNTAMFFIARINVQYLGEYVLLTTLVVFSMIGIGSVIGIISPNQVAAGIVGTPILMVLFIIPVIARLNNTLTKIAQLLPNYNINIVLDKVFKGQGIGSGSFYNILTILIWILITAIAFAYTYNKVGLDR